VYCGTTAERICMPFGMVSGVGGGMGVLDRVHVPQREGAVSGFFSTVGLNGQNGVFSYINVFDSYVKS